MTIWLGVDTGGTFTDFVLVEAGMIRTHKVLSTPDSPEQAILQGIRDLALADKPFNLIHGSTVATNAVLERKGAKTAFVTNTGFKDMLHIGRQARPYIYALSPVRPTDLVDEALCFEVAGRIDKNGDEITPLDSTKINELAQAIEKSGAESVAINLLFSFKNSDHEQRVAAAMPKCIFVSTSHQVLPEIREYERGLATYFNAYVGPKLCGYLDRLNEGAPTANKSIMLSAAGCVDLKSATQLGVQMLLSGPAGGLLGAKSVGDKIGRSKLLTFDMGGTSTDVALIDGEIPLTANGQIGEWPVAVPMVDMHTIGAGGGSYAYLDEGGVLQVGPESAGAMPGPVCYGRGGSCPTVTDANLVLGRILPSAFLGGAMKLDVESAAAAIKSLSDKAAMGEKELAEGIIRLANEHMVKALRLMSVERGYKPADFTLLSFGGAGGLHVCGLADMLGMNEAVVPSNAGVLSAYGMLTAPPSRFFSQAVFCHINDEDTINLAMDKLYLDAIDAFSSSGNAINEIEKTVDLRYVGQNSSISVPWSNANECKRLFQDSYIRRFKSEFSTTIEVVNIRIAIRGQSPKIEASKLTGAELNSDLYNDLDADNGLSVVCREDVSTTEYFRGPAIIIDSVSTTWLAEGWRAIRDEANNLLLRK